MFSIGKWVDVFCLKDLNVVYMVKIMFVWVIYWMGYVEYVEF